MQKLWSQIFVSGVTPRYGCQTKINELNSMLDIKQVESNYRFIKNENITFVAR